MTTKKTWVSYAAKLVFLDKGKYVDTTYAPSGHNLSELNVSAQKLAIYLGKPKSTRFFLKDIIRAEERLTAPKEIKGLNNARRHY